MYLWVRERKSEVNQKRNWVCKRDRWKVKWMKRGGKKEGGGRES